MGSNNIKDSSNSSGNNNAKSLKDEPGAIRLYNCFYFSVITFATVGLGDIRPNKWFKAAAIAESFLGWLTMALFLVTLGNVWLR